MNYQEFWNNYWSASHRIEPTEINPASVVHDIMRVFGRGKSLDLGCGRGQLVKALVNEGVDAIGVDVSEVALRDMLAGDLAERFQIASILDLPFKDNSFDSVVCINSLDYLTSEDLTLALSEIYRVCRRHIYLRVSLRNHQDTDRVNFTSRYDWEKALFKIGFRKALGSVLLQSYESFDNESDQIVIMFDKIQPEHLSAFPLNALLEERALHMDMLRESGHRSDAHLARYVAAFEFVRPGDCVLDAACGLGYGTALIKANTAASSVIGLDNSAFATKYANLLYGEANVSFLVGGLPALEALEDESVDLVLGFEILEYLEEPELILREVQRVLTPGGRFICSVSNHLIDESGSASNPYHFHTFDFPALCTLVDPYLLFEAGYSQTSGDGMVKNNWSRSLRRIPDLDLYLQRSEAPAEWWLLVGMKDPWGARSKPYRETVFPEGAQTPVNEIDFETAYLNPWLVRSMVSIGLRATSQTLLNRIALTTIETVPSGSVDAGAAVCVLLYSMMGDDAPKELPSLSQTQLLRLAEDFVATNVQTDDAQILRWRVSISYALGEIYLRKGNFEKSLNNFELCASVDASKYSPLLATKTVGACLKVARLCIGQEDYNKARKYCELGVQIGKALLQGEDRSTVLGLVAPPIFAWREMTVLLDLVQQCAATFKMLDLDPKWTGWKKIVASSSPIVEADKRYCEYIREKRVSDEMPNMGRKVVRQDNWVTSDLYMSDGGFNLTIAKVHQLSDEVNRRGTAIANLKLHVSEVTKISEARHAYIQYLTHVNAVEVEKLSKERARVKKIQGQLKKLAEKIKKLQKILKSAKSWQTRSWLKRAFHRWKAPKI